MRVLPSRSSPGLRSLRSCSRGGLGFGASLTLSARSPGVATAGRVLGIVGLCIAAAALVALGVYGLLEYVGSRD